MYCEISKQEETQKLAVSECAFLKVNPDFCSVWAHDDKPVKYRTNRNGRRVVDYDPRCIQTLYGIEQLRIVDPEDGTPGFTTQADNRLSFR